MTITPTAALQMAIEELTDAVAWTRAAIIAPSQAEQILLLVRKAQADPQQPPCKS